MEKPERKDLGLEPAGLRTEVLKPADLTARKLHLDGVVQGVGFRPLVYRLAQKYSITGWVLNSSAGLEVWVEGKITDVEAFCHEIISNPPRLARVLQQKITVENVQGYQGFEIRHSMATDRKEVLISPDIATCVECFGEIMDPDDRRYSYPFTNCTNCGPRYTIIQDVPYDRSRTTMHKFPMCPDCQLEYSDPGYRRFHAQPNACPSCGPALLLLDRNGEELNITRMQNYFLLQEIHHLLREGNILAVKGLGGFHLTCDALNLEAVCLLRKRKRRDYKPFALMARDLLVVKKYCQVQKAEEHQLTDPAGPILILDINQNQENQKNLPLEFLAPGLNTLGIMLPYTPLHHLLFGEDLELLVMTSANLSDDPLVTENQEALVRLSGIADYFLMHNRDIHQRCDDSLLRIVAGKKQFYRRARGYVPFPILLEKDGPAVLGVGGELKNTFCLTRNREAYLSQHLGDLNHWGNYQQFLEAIPCLEKMLEVSPQVVAHDLHPDYASTVYARGREDLIRIGIQHHHAHLAGCLTENREDGPALGVICDGTGYGTDGTLWGFEFLAGDLQGFVRLASLRPILLPGGEVSIRRPGRMTLAYIWQLFGENSAREWAKRLPLGISAEELNILIQQLSKGINSKNTSSCGRLFDAVAALLGICQEVGYEGQAAIELETIAEQALRQLGKNKNFNSLITEKIGRYCLPLVNLTQESLILPSLLKKWETPQIIWPESGADRGNIEIEQLNPNTTPKYWLDPSQMWEEMLADLLSGENRSLVALRFHLGVVESIALTCQKLCAETDIDTVVLSGGVFHNRILLNGLHERLLALGLRVLIPQFVPPNDGGISLGQAVIAREIILTKKAYEN